MTVVDFKTADLCDDYSNELQICQEEFKSYGKKPKFFGPIHTVKVFEDNVLVLKALETIPEGSVLVVDGGGSKRVALMGDRLAKIGQDRKLAGVILHACVRDTEDLADLDIGIFAIGSVPLRSIKEGKGDTQISLSFGGIQWKPGDYVYADQDGVVVAQRKLL